MLPKMMYISPTNVCNYNCGICARKEHMRHETGFMSMKLFKKIVSEIPNSVETVYLHKQGEPFLNRNLGEMVKHLKEERPNIKVKVNTNGSVITKYNKSLENVIKYADVLTISMWSIRPNTYKKLHNKDNYYEIITNIKMIMKLKEKLNSKIEIWVDYVIQRGNSKESKNDVIEFFKKRFDDITINFWWVVNFSGLGNEGNLQIYDKLSYRQFPFCIFPFISLNICWDGKVSYCFFDVEEKHSLGDANKESLIDIWNGKRFMEFRKYWLEKEFSKLEKLGILCRKCTFLWSTQTQNINQLPSDLLKRIFSKNNEKYMSIWGQLLKSENKTLKDFWGFRRKIN